MRKVPTPTLTISVAEKVSSTDLVSTAALPGQLADPPDLLQTLTVRYWQLSQPGMGCHSQPLLALFELLLGTEQEPHEAV